tara:strand:+ start:668 stop:949 length:282 start_codon:yes stop_codon:yes gene_type:complete
MKVNEIMERAGIRETGRAVAYIKDALEEMNLLSETHVKTARIDIKSGQRFYDLPNDLVKVLDIRCKGHETDDSTYRTIPRSIYEPETEDTDGI